MGILAWDPQNKLEQCCIRRKEQEKSGQTLSWGAQGSRMVTLVLLGWTLPVSLSWDLLGCGRCVGGEAEQHAWANLNIGDN